MRREKIILLLEHMGYNKRGESTYIKDVIGRSHRIEIPKQEEVSDEKLSKIIKEVAEFNKVDEGVLLKKLILGVE